jgi:hypothetical protein
MKRSGRRNGVAVLRGVSLLVCSAALLLFAAESVTLAQSVQTRHLRGEVKNGEAKFVNRLPATRIWEDREIAMKLNRNSELF